MSGTLFVVATPIGNLEDLSPRARQTLATVDLVAAEDTRRTGRLLSHFGLEKPLLALHDHNESAVCAALAEALAGGRTVALVSDAGTPLISDPGYRAVIAARQAGATVVAVPGPCAAVAALSVAGLPTDRFCFEGFLPARGGQRRSALAQLAGETRSMVFYEAVHRVGECLADLVAGFGGDRPAFLARELTKLHEQSVGGTLAELQAAFDDGRVPARGEFVIVVAGADRPPATTLEVDTLLTELAGRMPGREAAKIVARATGEKSNALYRRLLELNRDSGD